MEKEHKGIIEDWYEHPCSHGLEYYICGTSMSHPKFSGGWFHTSWVVKKDGDEIETRNSRYTLGKPIK